MAIWNKLFGDRSKPPRSLTPKTSEPSTSAPKTVGPLIPLQDEKIGAEAEQLLERATALLNQDSLSDASKLYDRAIQIFDQIVNRDGHLEFEGRLGKSYALKASTLQRLSDFKGASEAEDKRLVILERRLSRDPKTEYAEILAYACMDKAFLLRGCLKEPHQAVAFYDRAIQIFEGLVGNDGTDNQIQTLANMLGTRAEVTAELGDLRRARADGERALTILYRVMHSDRSYLASIRTEYEKLQIRLTDLELLGN